MQTPKTTQTASAQPDNVQPGTADIDAALERSKQYTRKLHADVQQSIEQRTAAPETRNEWESITGGVNPPAGYSLWTRRNAGERIWTFRQTSEGKPTPDSGGYFSIETAAKVKGFKMTDTPAPETRKVHRQHQNATG